MKNRKVVKYLRQQVFVMALIILGIAVAPDWTLAAPEDAIDVDYRLLATNKTSTMQRELNQAARDGFVLVEAKGGKTEHGGDELVAIVARRSSGEQFDGYEYLVLATNRTGTMERELNDAARRGFAFVAQTVFTTAFGGQEVVVIVQRSPTTIVETPVCEYALLATSRTSTMQKELSQFGRKGFLARGLSVSETAVGGKEVVVVTERCVMP